MIPYMNIGRLLTKCAVRIGVDIHFCSFQTRQVSIAEFRHLPRNLRRGTGEIERAVVRDLDLQIPSFK